MELAVQGAIWLGAGITLVMLLARRRKRRQEAEERAGKVGVKLVFPIFFFILPSMLIVAAGPGILQIFKYLFPMMNKIGQ